jgi:hypothetical protein
VLFRTASCLRYALAACDLAHDWVLTKSDPRTIKSI